MSPSQYNWSASIESQHLFSYNLSKQEGKFLKMLFLIFFTVYSLSTMWFFCMNAQGQGCTVRCSWCMRALACRGRLARVGWWWWQDMTRASLPPPPHLHLVTSWNLSRHCACKVTGSMKPGAQQAESGGGLEPCDLCETMQYVSQVRLSLVYGRRQPQT